MGSLACSHGPRMPARIGLAGLLASASLACTGRPHWPARMSLASQPTSTPHGSCHNCIPAASTHQHTELTALYCSFHFLFPTEPLGTIPPLSFSSLVANHTLRARIPLSFSYCADLSFAVFVLDGACVCFSVCCAAHLLFALLRAWVEQILSNSAAPYDNKHFAPLVC